MKINEKTAINLDLKTIAIIITMAVSVSGTYFTLKADIEENKKALENGNWVSATEYDLKDELTRTTVQQNAQSLEEIKAQLNTIDQRIYNLNK